MRLALLTLFIAVATPLSAHAALEVSAWLPYWRTASSTADAAAHLSVFTELNPFGYSVKSDGTIADTARLEASSSPWGPLIAAAREQKIRIIPTLMWSDGGAIHRILSDGPARRKLEDDITALVVSRGYDGIDIDFEGKMSKTRPYFATFLKGLYMRMGKKWVMCDIEPRTPLSSRYDSTPPPDVTDYANDYTAIAQYCDRVRIMAYDQGTIDLKLNTAAHGEPYIPIADPAWVKKVITETAKTIPKRKLVLGVPTYGYEYSVTPLTQSGYRYDLLWAFNPKYADNLAAQYHPIVVRNTARERSFTYIPNVFPGAPPTGTDPASLSGNAPEVTQGGEGKVAGSSYNILWWSDAAAIADKVALAQSMGLRGVAVFKIDGGEDPGIWDVIK